MKQKSNLYLLLFLLLALIVSGSGLAPVRAQTPNRAGLVVRFGDGSVINRCVDFSEPEITGYDLLQRSGLSTAISFDQGMGAFVCKIEHEGCPVDDCMCQYPPSFWAYWILQGGQWQFAPVGATGRRLSNGDVDGWAWGAGTTEGGTAPPATSFDQICPPLVPPATDTPLPTDTALPPTATPVPPTFTPVPPSHTPEPVVWFRLDQNPIEAGSCTLLRWDTSGVRELFLDGEPVPPNGAHEVCPTQPQRYVLRVITDGQEEQTHTLDLGVTGAPPAATPTATTLPLSPSPSSPSPTKTVPAATPTAETLAETLLPTARESSRVTETAETPVSSPPLSETPSMEPVELSSATSSPTTEPTRQDPTSSPPSTQVEPVPTATPAAVAGADTDASQVQDSAATETETTDTTNNMLSYVIFGALVVVLGAVLAGWQVLQRRRQ